VSFLESGLTFVSAVKPDSRKDTPILTTEPQESLVGFKPNMSEPLVGERESV
jgi:hypothetical protein